MTAEWKPINPCGDCNSKLKGELCKDWLECNDSLIYEGEIKGQTKLLEHIYKLLQEGNWISATSVQQMLGKLSK